MNSTVTPVEFAGGCLGRERHICAFFNSADEEYRSLLPFIKEGFDHGGKGRSYCGRKAKGRSHRPSLSSGD